MKKTNLPSTILLGTSEVELRYKRPLFLSMQYICCPNDADIVLREFVDLERIDLKEFFWVLLLTNANRLIALAEISSGSATGVKVNAREIFQLALRVNASSFIVAHCHPSGNLTVSQGDRLFTERLKELSQLLELTLVDHIIITSESHTSLVGTGDL